MSKEDSLPQELRNTGVDHLTVSARAVLGMVPVVGSLISELVGVSIPRQRMDRVVKFAALLEHRLVKLESDTATAKWQEDRFLELAEEVVRQAARATSDQRREYLAAVISTEMTQEQLKESDSRHLLRILGELNDTEVVWLRHYAGNSISEWEEFSELHREVLEQKPYADYPSDEERLAASTLRDSYLSHLAQLALLDEQLVIGHGNLPELEWGGKKFRKHYGISSLGMMLLEMIGFNSRGSPRLTEFEK